jgi:hypothetical protein
MKILKKKNFIVCLVYKIFSEKKKREVGVGESRLKRKSDQIDQNSLRTFQMNKIHLKPPKYSETSRMIRITFKPLK